MEIEAAYRVDPNHAHGYDRVHKHTSDEKQPIFYANILFTDVIVIVLCIQVGGQFSILWNKPWHIAYTDEYCSILRREIPERNLFYGKLHLKRKLISLP